MKEKYQKIFENLEKNNFETFYAETRNDVVPIIKSIMPIGSSVCNGGSVTLTETGVIDLLDSGDYRFFDRRNKSGEELKECFCSAFNCDFYFTSSNALIEEGALYNVDGNANRISAISFGAKNVIVVIGKNKIVKNLDEAIKRVKTVSAPKNAIRLNADTPCKELGRCVAVDGEMYSGCKSNKRICCIYALTGFQRVKSRIKVILVNENLGY